MKPLYLSFKGLNSFSECAEIDFTKLTQSGIFGIFGDTGSGKSTILDAINFALYGDVGRSKEKTDIINYKCDSVEVEFTFNVLVEGKRKNYTVQRSIKRKSGVHKACLYEEADGESLCIADNASTVKQQVIKIIGVSADDFRKCIALPQGEFAEFVKSDPAERIKLIERLFNLSKYGETLKSKLRSLYVKTEGEYQNLCGELKPYENDTRQAADDISAKIIQLTADLKTLEKQKAEAESGYNIAKELHDKKLQLDEARKNLYNLSLQAEEMQKLKQNLKLLPDCKRIITEDGYAKDKEKAIKSETERLKDIEQKIAASEKAIAEARDNLEKLGYDEKLARLNEQAANLAAAKSKFEELEEIRAKLKQTQLDYEQADDLYKKQQKKLTAYQEKLQELKTELEKIPAINIESILSDEVKNSFIREAVIGEFNYICELRENIKVYKSDSKLYNYVTRELTQRIDYLANLMRGNTTQKVDLKQFINDFQSNYDLREKYKERVANGEKLVSQCESELRVLQQKIEQKVAESKERSLSFQKIFAELSQIYGSQPDYIKLASGIEEQKMQLTARRDKLKERYESERENYNALTEQNKSCIKYIGLLQSELSSRLELIEELLKQGNFGGVDECRTLIKEFGDFEGAQKRHDDYIAAIKFNNETVEKLKNIDGVENVTEQQVAELSSVMRQSEAAIRNVDGEIKVCANNLKTLQERLAKKDELLKELANVNERRNLVGMLDAFIRGNGFMKYVAGGHLGDISKVASKMLLDLTDGRYFLIYKDGFFVGDNFNGGSERCVNTLSGGETFLVSLSLALALSGVICARSNKNIEFFFLDEGFGTLDETLIEVVMGALEKLKNSHFTIGIISHVEELKHRIQSKIIVNKATESHGSTLTLSC